jgi:predicted RecA/RadA family phage recombinase
MQAIFIQPGQEIDHTPSGNVVAGQVVVQQGLVGIAKTAIAAGKLGSLSVSGIFDVQQNAEAITAGSAVYWNAAGTPVGGTATGCATATAGANVFMGFAQATTVDSDLTVRVALRSAKTTAGGVAEATSITADASTLPIAGLAAEQGGAVSVTGGASSTAGNAGGAVTLTGGLAGATGVGGAATVTGGGGGATSGTGGKASIVGGAARSQASNAVGGAAAVTGGLGKGNLAGGAVELTGGVGGNTAGAGGAITIAAGAGGTNGAGGAVTIAGGAGTATDGAGGNVTILGGLKNGSGTSGVLALGTSNTSAINVGATGIVTAVAGSLQVRGVSTVTAIAGGATTGLIPAGASFVVATSDNNDKQISLPAASVGDEIEILVVGAKCELISAVTAHKVNNVTVGETNELSLTQDSLYRCKYVATNNWIVTGIDKLGAAEAALVPDAL